MILRASNHAKKPDAMLPISSVSLFCPFQCIPRHSEHMKRLAFLGFLLRSILVAPVRLKRDAHNTEAALAEVEIDILFERNKFSSS